MELNWLFEKQLWNTIFYLQICWIKQTDLAHVDISGGKINLACKWDNRDSDWVTHLIGKNLTKDKTRKQRNYLHATIGDKHNPKVFLEWMRYWGSVNY